MTSDRWKQIETLFHQALEKRPDERSAFLDATCGDDSELRAEVQTLLRRDDLDDGIPNTRAGMTSGSRLGQFEILSALGKGGMGEVYRARDTKLGRQVAIKVLPAEFARDEERLARLEREARMLAALNHPNVAAIYGLEEFEGTRFLALELVEGDTLADLLKGGAIPAEESLKLALQIAEALEAAHQKGVIHRDLKPANIKITPEGRVKVLDFGLAKAFEATGGDPSLSSSPTLSMAATRAGVILGTAPYMSPEQAKGHQVDRRADIWALGSVLYEMLSGRQAFGAPDVAESLAAVIRGDPDWSRLPTVLHPRLREILERCLEKDLRRRFQDVGDLRNDLESLLDDPTGVRIRAAASAVPLPGGRLPWVVAALFAGIAAVLGVLMLRPAGPDRIVRYDHMVGPESFTSEASQLIAISPDGTQLAYVADQQIYLRPMDETEPRPIVGTDQNATTPFFSPDGTSLGFWSGAERELKRVAVAGGVPVPLTTANNPRGARWESDGTILYAQPDGVWRVADTGGTSRQIVQSDPGDLLWGPQTLPGGTHLLYSLGPFGESDVVVEDLDSHERRVVQAGGRDARYLATGHLLYASGDALFAAGFDPETLSVDGGQVLVVGRVRTLPGVQPAQYAVSDNGTLVYVSPDTIASETGVPAIVDADGVPHRMDVSSRRYRNPRVSPEGNTVAVEILGDSGESSIWLLDRAGAEPIRLTGERTGSNSRPVWTSDGEYIAFASDRDGTQGIWWQRADRTEEARRLTQAEEGVTHHPESWSPDGGVLMFSRVTSTDWDLWTHTLASNETSVFYEAPNNQFGSALSPDGQWLALTDTRPGIPVDQPFVVQVQRFPDGPRQELQPGSWPVWSSNGRSLFYRSNALNSPDAVIRRIDLDLEPAIRVSRVDQLPVGNFLTLATYRNFDLTPDDELVIIVPDEVPAPSEAGSIRVVLNWTQELLERVPVD